MKTIETQSAPAAIGPYSQAVQVGGFLDTSGQIPIDPKSGQIEGSEIRAQAEPVIRNLRAVLEAAGCTLADVVKTTCFLKNMGDFEITMASDGQEALKVLEEQGAKE